MPTKGVSGRVPVPLYNTGGSRARNTAQPSLEMKGAKTMTYPISDKMKDLKPSAIREIFKYAVDPAVISLAAGDPAPESLPLDEIKQILETMLDDNPKALLYSQSEGHPPFREAVRQMLQERYQIGQEFDQVLITSGAQQVMDLTTKVLCNEGDVVICESPSFIGSLNTFRSYGVRLVGVPLEDDGISIEGLRKALAENPTAKLIYVIPNFQNPTGITMSLAKRKAVYALAKEYQVVVLEDNPYGDLRFAGDSIPAIKTLDTEGLVVYAGTFSKILSSGTRVGYCAAPAELMQKLVVAKQCTDVHTSMLGQLVCYQFLQQTDLEQHMKGLTTIYADKCTHMLAEMDRCFPPEASHTCPQGGLFVWVTLPDGMDGTEFATRLVRDRKICVVPGTAFAIQEGELKQNIRVNFSMPSKEQITKGIEQIGALMQEMMAE